MVKITVYQSSSGHYIGVRCFGHSGYAESGHDVVCAAVSVLMINAINSVEQLTTDGFDCQVDEKKALIDFKLKEAGAEALLLVKSLVLGLNGIASEYGKKFIKIDSKEV